MSEEFIKESLTEAIYNNFGTGGCKAKALPALSLAYIGDCIYDVVIRTILTTHEGGTNNSLHKKSSAIVKAQSQAALMDAIEEDLSQEELAIFKHGRNAKNSSSAKNASIVAYRKATGLEALIGYLYLEGQFNRLCELIKIGLLKTGQMNVEE